MCENEKYLRDNGWKPHGYSTAYDIANWVWMWGKREDPYSVRTAGAIALTKEIPLLQSQASALGNYELVLETISAGAGDDYDGCFTDKGQLNYSILKQELSKRLIDVGFIDNELG